jgi:hypothetical protein
MNPHVTRTWTKFIRAVAADDQIALKNLEGLIAGWCCDGRAIECDKLSAWPRFKILDAIESARPFIVEEPTVTLPIPDDLTEKIYRVFNRILDEIREDQQCLVDFVAWYKGNEQEFLNRQKEMWDEIINQPKYGLRTGGLDRIKIGLAILKRKVHHYQSLQLFPEDFPKAKGKFWLKHFDDPVSITFELDPLKDALSINFRFDRDDPRAIMNRALYYIALDCYHRIITGKHRKNPSKTLLPASVAKQQLGANITRFAVVRPHFRLLPSGYHASGQAIDHALLGVGYAPPQGFTFVREHERGYAYIDSIDPLFTYSEDDLGYKP